MARSMKLGLYVITYSQPELERGHLDVARAALEGGADVLQLRDKELGGLEMFRLAVDLRDMADKAGGGCVFLVNDRVDVAVAAGADGVHLGQEDLPAPSARSLIGADMVMGISATTREQAEQAMAQGADYLGVGPVFATPTKPDVVAPIGIAGLREIRKAVDLPIVAIGGIDENNAEEVFEEGADGIAVISAVTGAEDMLEAVRRLRRAVDDGLAER
jgi:thiamine-phosphate pyrophosphorylase